MKYWFILFYVLSPVSWGSDNSAQQSAPAYKSPDPFSFESILQLLLGLGLVLGTILLMAYLLRKVSVLPGQHRKLKVVAALSLGQKERAVLVQIGEEQILLGVSQGQVTLLKSFDQPVITPDQPAAESVFARKLNQYISKRSQ